MFCTADKKIFIFLCIVFNDKAGGCDQCVLVKKIQQVFMFYTKDYAPFERSNSDFCEYKLLPYTTTK